MLKLNSDLDECKPLPTDGSLVTPQFTAVALNGATAFTHATGAFTAPTTGRV